MKLRTGRPTDQWMQTWPVTMAKGPTRFVALYAVGFVCCMAFGRAVVAMWSSSIDWTNVGSWDVSISLTVLHAAIGVGIGLAQWKNSNRVYAEKSGDLRARAWAENSYELPMAVWFCAVVALAVVMTVTAAQMAWASGAPMLWAVALLCIGVGSLALFTMSQLRAKKHRLNS